MTTAIQAARAGGKHLSGNAEEPQTDRGGGGSRIDHRDSRIHVDSSGRACRRDVVAKIDEQTRGRHESRSRYARFGNSDAILRKTEDCRSIWGWAFVYRSRRVAGSNLWCQPRTQNIGCAACRNGRDGFIVGKYRADRYSGYRLRPWTEEDDFRLETAAIG